MLGDTPLHVFRFRVEFRSDSVTGQAGSDEIDVCHGAFSECTGLEATMEVKNIKEGGRNYGSAVRAGVTSFSTVVLKRGISENKTLWTIYNKVAIGTFAPRLQVIVRILSHDGADVVRSWQLRRAMPVKFKFADMNARGTEVGIEELHLAHEGLFAV